MKLLFFFFLSISFSCADSTQTGYKFDKEKSLTGTIIPVDDSVHLRYPFRVKFADSLLYVLDLHGPDFYCHTFSYPDMTPITSLAHRGDGPEEFLRVENIRLDQQGAICLLDANKNVISIYNSKNYQREKHIDLSDTLIRCLDFALICDSLFVIPDYSGKYRINIVDGNGNLLQQLFKIPTRNKDNTHISDIILAQAWRSFIDYNRINGILAMATQLGHVVEIYNLKTLETINIVYGKLGEPEFSTKEAYAVPNGIMGYSDVFVGKDKIYALFWGTSFRDIRNNPLDRMEGGNMLHVFSLTGNPIIQYNLDRHITGFSINENNHTLLGLDVNSEQQFIKYQL